jgi:Uma2 family endonuclease
VIFDEEDAVIPDVIFSTHETIKKNVNLIGKHSGKFNAAPDLVIEVLSFGKKDIERDRFDKREVYSKYGVTEYWIINDLYKSIEIYHLKRRGLELVDTAHVENEISSPLLPGFRLKVSEVFKFI